MLAVFLVEKVNFFRIRNTPQNLDGLMASCDPLSSACCFVKSCDGDSSEFVSGVEVRWSAGSGRGLWSTEEVAEGAVLFANEPSAHVLAAEFIDQRCSNCFSTAPSDSSGGLNQCGKCKYVRYW